MGEYQSKNKKPIAEQVTSFDTEWQKLLNEEKEKNDPNRNKDVERFFSALEYGEKNRYSEVLALDKTRVKLYQVKNECDYINANWVDGILEESKYIAAQAPLPHTMADFWSMVWDQNIDTIIMLTNLSEGGKTKAHIYWPDQSSKQYGDIFVNFKSEEELLRGTIIKRTFIVSKNSVSGLRSAMSNSNKKLERKIIQYHYTTWPDHGAPVESDSLLALIEHMDDLSKKKIQNGPCLVHCSAGIGRTGTFVLIHSYIQYFKTNGILTLPDGFTLKETLSRMRNQRDGFVQRLSQYVFCYKTLERYFTCIVNNDNNNNSENGLKNISENSDDQPIRIKPKGKRRRFNSSTSLDTSNTSNILKETETISEEDIDIRKSGYQKKRIASITSTSVSDLEV